MMRVLLVEDETGFAGGLKRRFAQEGIEVDMVSDGRQGLDRARSGGYDLVLLDLMLPKMDGIEVCRELRRNSEVPVIMLTARDDDVDKILGLEIGADDYLTKPFNFRELQARIRAVMRRARVRNTPGVNEERIQLGGLILDARRRAVLVDGDPVDVTAREFDLLWLLACHPERVFTREELLDRIWGFDHHGDTRMVNVQVRRLRQKIESDRAEPRFLRTKWGVGYYLIDEECPR
ncbi:MAG: response regulator transcription factor [Firmicutes bacterium]|nr:response regulator transcription factor [Bacillota bacterium]